MDPFEVRMQFLAQLKRLSASQPSIQKTVSFALKYFSRCGEDLWDCIVEECQKGSTNTRINIFYFLDSLCETSLASRPSTSSGGNFYVSYVTRDLKKVVDLVVPDGRVGLLNLMSTTQVLESWRAKRVIDPAVVSEVLESLEQRQKRMHDLPTSNEHIPSDEVQKRIEEDRERHKRLRERRWVQPTTRALLPPRLASFYPLPRISNEFPIDVEFDNAWETTSDWNEDDDEAAQEENALCFPDAGASYKETKGR
ncbi:CTD kinase subunit gamma CTK3-domain-containing protein [Hysterangium stoloniferum]|nr:CTD kinase subunit gamma CTK3-domain-containing protein [Hysterangium stoloniferum]